MTGPRNPSGANQGGISGRGIFGLILCLILPPLGLLYIWRLGVYPLRGRIVVSLLACVSLTLIFYSGIFGLFSWSSEPATVQPVPGAAVAVTVHPDDETLNALSNIDDIIAQNMDNDPDETVDPDATPILTQDEMLAQQQEILDTVVYSVFSGAKYYHVSTVCGNQSNGRELTIAEALAEQMAACPNCDPPALR